MGKGKIIYRGNISKLVIGHLGEESYVLKKDAYFYKNRFGKMISYDYGTVLPSYDEAREWLEHVINESDNDSNTVDCMYVDYDKLKYEVIPVGKMKVLDRFYRHRKKR